MPNFFLAGKSQEQRARDVRNLHPVHVYVGSNGTGKSLTAVWDTLPTLDAGRPALSTVRLLDYTNPRACEGWRAEIVEWVQEADDSWRPRLERVDCDDQGHGRNNHQQAHPLWIPFVDYRQLLDWRWGDVLMDEVTGVADAQEWASIPQVVINKFPQLRRDECTLRVTGLDWMNVAKRIRQAALALTVCHSTMPVPRSEQFGQGRRFRPRRLVIQTTYEARTLPRSDVTEQAKAKAKIVGKGRLWVPDCIARTAYDTFSPVLAIGSVTDAGRCVTCGGNRRAPECSCADYVHDREGRKAARAQALAPSTGRTRPIGRHVIEAGA